MQRFAGNARGAFWPLHCYYYYRTYTCERAANIKREILGSSFVKESGPRILEIPLHNRDIHDDPFIKSEISPQLVIIVIIAGRKGRSESPGFK